MNKHDLKVIIWELEKIKTMLLEKDSNSVCNYVNKVVDDYRSKLRHGEYTH